MFDEYDCINKQNYKPDELIELRSEDQTIIPTEMLRRWNENN